MISKPILKIDKFSGMFDGSQTVYLDGFAVGEQGKSVQETYSTLNVRDNSTYGSQFNKVYGIEYVYPLTDSNIRSVSPYTIMISGGRLFSYTQSPIMFNGDIGGVASGGAFLGSQKPDIKEMSSGNLIYTSARHLSLAVRGLTSATHTDKIIDKDGRDFTTLGIAAGDKITNLITGKQYTVTSISTTTKTNDTLNFNAITGFTNTANDEFLVIDLEAFDLLGVSGSSKNPQFISQPAGVHWSRPIRKWGDQYMIGNGNYIALLAADEKTFDSTYKQLPTGFQLLALEVGKLGDILVSAYDKNGIGYLLYWDGFNNGWNEITQIDRAAEALHPYKSGWVYFVDGTLYFTNGRDIQQIAQVSSRTLSQNISVKGFNGIKSVDDKIFLACSGYDGKMASGVYIFDGNGFSFVKCLIGSNQFATPYSIYLKNSAQIDSIFSNNFSIDIGCGSSLNELSHYKNSSTATRFRSVMLKIDLEQETQVKEVWLNLQPISDFISTIGSQNKASIQVNVGDGSLPPYTYCQADPITTTTVNVVGTTRPGVVGEEFEFVSPDYSISGERFFIESIANAGQNPETWTISPALSSATAGYADGRTIGVKKGEEKTISIYDLSKPVRFNVNFLGSIMYLEIITKGTTNNFPLSIKNIQLF